MNERCIDDRFEIIKETKEYIIRATNIESDESEMNVLDSICFRLWQLGLTKRNLDKLRKYENIMTEQEVLKKFEELGYEIKLNNDNVLKFIIKDEDTVLRIYKTSKDYKKIYYSETKIIPEVITLQEHQLLTELFKCYKWID